mmetsp:Transcript_20376/g.47669  ORF Transcript_20376/g.47669 Transcript_20376/m.47669 type:complete len:854 (-) Transcript_20376:171-2732(-)|eukprot:CAMPEP_0171110316 /NCGR_PEP_ID=MMETSP0766_2-20121228/71277_1 /TAXON_ID=439317 /ORGANISM="Gambierdiscus australes, Strain CAWD 149" /LENGTH=853 /DNA_ID=CAMNT_0011572165 /DNA_START=60 /DNA_END=2621 /DNA_ORIENTATION=-
MASQGDLKPQCEQSLASLSAAGSFLWSKALVPGLRSMIRKGCLRVVFNGVKETFGDGSGTEVEIHVRSEFFLWRTLLDPGMGVADAFVEGEIEVRPDIIDFFHLVLANKDKDPAASPMSWMPVRLVTPVAKRYYAFLHSRRANSLAGSKKNIAEHYDLSNAMFGMFLSADMTYSSGIFDEEVEALQKEGKNGKDFLELAQRKKLDRLLDLIELQAGDRVLEVGCGWGSMAIRAVERCPDIKSWTAITLSVEQKKLAEERIASLGYSDRISIVICDYREAAARFGAGSFSKAVSCEMIEAVGHEFLPAYFAALDECLQAGGRVAIQAICVPDSRYESYRQGSDFIRERIFPGSSLVSLEEIERACKKGQTSLVEAAPPFSVGHSYAKTLREWRRRFGEHEEAVRGEVSTFGNGFDDRFVRRWHYYFAYCEAGFESGHIDNWQVCLRKAASVETGKTARVRSDRSFNGDALHGARQGLLTTQGAMHLAVCVAQRMLDRGMMPDWLTRFGIRRKLAQKIREETFDCVSGSQAAKMAFVEELRKMPIAICTAEANEQHYEVPPELYHILLGPRKKYSACLYPENGEWKQAARAGELLPEAEEQSLLQVDERAGMEDGLTLLDLGCGWGSCSLFMAARYPKALVVGVSNSHGQRGWILERAKERGLENLRIVTCDVSQTPLAEAVLPVLREARPAAEGFDRVISIEMFEHMKNYDVLLERVSDVMKPGARLFVHVFVHSRFNYHFTAKTESDWMARYFFAGGIMQSADLLFYFQRNLKLLQHWHVNGRHYGLTAEGWLQNMDSHASEVMKLLASTYPAGTEVMWFNRWRAFFMALSELFAYRKGNEWIVAHYLFEKPA